MRRIAQRIPFSLNVHQPHQLLHLLFHRLQAVVGSLLSRLVPRARIVKVVRPEDMNPGEAVCRCIRCAPPLAFTGSAARVHECRQGMLRS